MAILTKILRVKKSKRTGCLGTPKCGAQRQAHTLSYSGASTRELTRPTASRSPVVLIFFWLGTEQDRLCTRQSAHLPPTHPTNLPVTTSGPSSTELLSPHRLYAELEERLLLCGRAECGIAYKLLAGMEEHHVSALLCQRLTHSNQRLCPHTFRDTWAVPPRTDGSSALLAPLRVRGCSCRRR